MKKVLCSNPSFCQQGDALIEAMVGIVLMSVIGLGLSYSASRAVLSQRYLNTQNIVVSQIRETLSANQGSISGFCQTGNIPSFKLAGKQIAATAKCQKGAVLIRVGENNDNSGDSNGVGKGVSNFSVALPADSLVTSLTVATPATPENAELIGGDGVMEISL